MKKTLLLTAACSLIFGSAAAGEIETAQRYTAPSVSVELTTVAVQGNAAVSEQTEIGQNMMAGNSAEVQEIGFVADMGYDKAEVQDLGLANIAPRDKAEVRELGGGQVHPMRSNSTEVQELGGVNLSGDARNNAEVRELGLPNTPPRNSAEVQELGDGDIRKPGSITPHKKF